MIKIEAKDPENLQRSLIEIEITLDFEPNSDSVWREINTPASNIGFIFASAYHLESFVNHTVIFYKIRNKKLLEMF